MSPAKHLINLNISNGHIVRHFPLDTGRKLNVHATFMPYGRLIYVMCPGEWDFSYLQRLKLLSMSMKVHHFLECCMNSYRLTITFVIYNSLSSRYLQCCYTKLPLNNLNLL